MVKSVEMELYEISTVSEFNETIFRIAVLSTEIVDGKRAPVSLDACAELSRMISPLLDVTPPVSGDYRMEVGSPGIERKLNSIKNFSLSIGEKVSLLLNDKTKIRGILTKVDGSKISVHVDAEELTVEYSEINKAKTYFEW